MSASKVLGSLLGTLLALAVATAPLAAQSRITNLTVGQVKKLLGEQKGNADFVVLDVRTPAEFAAGALPGATNLDIQAKDFESRLGRLDRGKSYLVYCRSGNRSTRAVQAMEKMGFRSIYHMTEGMLGWEKR